MAIETLRGRILQALKDHLESNVLALDFGIRHWRHRDASESEWPCVSIRYVSRDLPGVNTAASPSAAQLSNSEEIVELSVDLIADAALPPEDSNVDPTGLETVGKMIERCLDTLFTPGEQPESLGGLLINIVWDGDGADEENSVSTPDSARLAERLTLVYRARTEYPIGILEGN